MSSYTNICVNNHEIYVEDHGDNTRPTVILLHHGLGSTLSWHEFIPILVNAGYRAIAYDRWGYGRSDIRHGLAIPYFLDDIIDLFEITKRLCDSPVTLIGHSDGGTIALFYASRYPEMVDGLVCVAAHIYVEQKMVQGIEEVKRQFLTDQRFQRGLRRVHGDRFKLVFDNWYSGWVNPENLKWDMRPLLTQVSCPCLIIQGKNDEHASMQQAIDLVNSLPNAQLWLLENVGHMVPKEASDEFNQEVLSFLEQKCSIKY